MEKSFDGKFYSLLNDFAFKWVFGQKSNSKILITLLNSILGYEGDDEIQTVEYLNPFNYQNHKRAKLTVVDVRVKDGKGNLYTIELQNSFEPFFAQRSLYYLAKLYSSQMMIGEIFSSLKPAIGISFMNFELFKGSQFLKETFTFKNTRNTFELDNSMTLHLIDLTKYDGKKPLKERTAFEKWLHALRFSDEYDKIKEMITCSQESLAEKLKEGKDMIVDGKFTVDEAISFALLQLKKLNSNPKNREQLEDYENFVTDIQLIKGASYKQGHAVGHAEGHAEGREEGKEEGKQEEKQAIAKNMRDSGMNMSKIIKFTGLSEEEIKRL